MTKIDTQDSRLTVRLFGTKREERINGGIDLSIKLLKHKQICEVKGFKDKYELMEFENIFNAQLGYNKELKDNNYLRIANEKQLNYTIRKI